MESTHTSYPYPCHINPTISNEQFVPNHLFIHIISGTMTLYDGNKEYTITAGDYCFIKRNHLIKYTKKAPAGGEFKTVSVYFSQDFLKSFSREYNYTADETVSKDSIIGLNPDPLLESYIQSLAPYQKLTGKEHDDFLLLKDKEIALLLVKIKPELKDVLFDFNDPGKIDLKAFMNSNYKFNVSLNRFSYLTGRSLTTFKRDFEKIFNTSPGRWLLEKRLQEAHFLIEKKGQHASEVYLELGFEDLSHFSFAFKKMYGISPNQLKK